jgi:hypothetical protein
MNSRQALKAASKRIEHLEFRVKINIMDIRDYNACIEALIKGESPCPWCNDQEECQNANKGHQGCPEWVVRDNAKVALATELTDDGMIQFGGENES